MLMLMPYAKIFGATFCVRRPWPMLIWIKNIIYQFGGVMKKILVIACALMLCMGNAVAFADVIKIGLMGPLTGKWASEGQDMKNVVGMLVDKINKAGGINGDTIELIVEDDAGDPRSAALAAQKLASAEVVAVIGTYGSAVTEASQNILNEAGIVQIGTGATSVRLTEKGYKNFFRTCPRDDAQGIAAAGAIEKNGYKTVALVHDNSSYAKGLAEETKAILDKKGVKIVFFDAISPGERDYNAVLTKLRSAKPEAIFFTGYYPEAGMLLRQKSEMGWDAPFMGGDAANHLDLVKIAGNKAAEGFFFISPPLPQDLDSKEADAFLKEYKDKYNTVPISVYAVLAGDAFKAIEAAIKAGKKTSKDMMEYLPTIKGLPGFTGEIGFNEKGDRVGDFYRTYIVNNAGTFVLQPL